MHSEKFWSQFEKTFWEKKPKVFKSNSEIPVPRFSKDTIFNLVVELSNGVRKQNFKNEFFRLYLNGVEFELNKELEFFLPRASDGSFEFYHRRCMSYDGVIEYGLIINQLLGRDKSIWEKFCVGFKPFFERFGIPIFQLEGGMFIGNYTKTPFGIHIDRSSVFTFPIIGTKKIRTWQPEYVKKNPDMKESLDYKRHLKKSLLLRANPGDVMYWPSKTWHIGESNREFCVTLIAGYWFGAFAKGFVLKEFQKKALSPIRTLTNSDTIPLSKRGLADVAITQENAWRRELNSLREYANSDEFERTLALRWIEHVSAYGFGVVPQIGKQERIGLGQTLQLNPAFPIVWHLRPDDECLISCRGHSFAVKKAKWMPMFCQLINTGKPFTVKEISDKFLKLGVSKKQITEFLQKVHDRNGFESNQQKMSDRSA